MVVLEPLTKDYAYCCSYVFIVTFIFGSPTVFYSLSYFGNIGFLSDSETHRRISWKLIPNRNYMDPKYILTWCEAYGGFNYGWEFGDEKFRSAGCPESRCFLTSDRDLLGSVSEFDAIVFHQRSFEFSDSPSHRVPGQRYVHWMFESPAHPEYDPTPTEDQAGFYNWSMSYRLDSDFPLPYGKFQQVHELPQTNLDAHIQQFGRENRNLSRKTNTKGKGIAAWFVSNCDSKSGREELVKKLKKHIAVDVYGESECSDPGLRCDRSREGQCLQMLDRSYKFYLSLENSLCADYVTEKFWKVLDLNVIPVVLNGANMSLIAPKHSYIDFKDFNNSIKETAEYMVKVSQDDSLFASYFWWREFYSPTQSVEAQAWCSLCSALHNRSLGEAVISDLHHWWVEEAHCHSAAT